MHLLGPLFLLLEYLAFSNSFQWNLEHPATLYAWEGACVWIPCRYTIPGDRMVLENLTVYQNYTFDEKMKDYTGTILYEKTKSQMPVPQGRVKFLGDNKSNCTLHIHPVKAQDSGMLGLRMTSSKSVKWMEEIVLNVSEAAPPPRIEVPPEILEFQEVILTCLLNFACFEHQIKLMWLLEGSRQLPSDLSTSLTTQTVFTQSKLTLQPRWTHHGKNLTCQVWNDATDRPLSQETVWLDVKHRPKLEVSPKEAIVTVDDPVTMTCQVISSNPEFHTLSWLKDGTPIREQETLQREQKTLKLTLPKVTKRMSGKYHCEAHNDLGSSTSEMVLLQVRYSPKEVTMVIQNPTPIREGDSVTLSCNYTSSNPSVTRYDWKPKGSWKELVPGVLTIQKVAWNAMPFTCAACNQWCSWAPPVNLQVQYAPRDVKVLMISPSFEIHSGHAVLLRCNFSSSRPTDVHFFWEKNGIFLKEGRELSFGSISPEDAGSYSCVASNSIGQSTSKAWELPVLYAPRRLRVSISPKDSVMEGKEAVLTCESDANPPTSHYTWFDWNNQDLHHNHRTLRLDPVKVQHSGAYWCQGSNRLGVDRSPPSTLTVYYSPQTISRRVALGLGLCLVILFLAFLGVKFQRSWKRIQSQQGPQENSSGQSFFVRNNKVRRAPLPEGLQSLGCYNPVMEDSISYATLRFPAGETDTPRIGDGGTPEVHRPSLNRDNTVTYSVVQKRPAGDYENVIPDAPDAPEDDGIHYSELVHLGVGERPLRQEGVEYVTLKH
ncbi:B-cell receptor CD22 isoform X2 [Eptesicus fuscus]|uniref:B-cell receptor CD22 isoform X2 n=1 Tax=Eptesicus fuscus TaxID=29078 RepID=UPI002403AD95|nr:B-cell receptor CD22 isoform X2 [Eptesicus fuscus]